MSRFSILFANLQKDLKTYLFLLLLLCAYRGYFIFHMQEYIGQNVVLSDIGLAMWAGFRLSLKSAGAGVLLSFLACTMSGVLLPKLHTDQLRYVMGCIYITLLSILFQARIPYYQEFHVTFNQNIFNTFKDDVNAIAVTMVQQYNLPLRLLAALVIAYMLCKLFKRVLKTKTIVLPRFASKPREVLFKLAIVLFIPVFMLFMRFGGSFNYNHSINWENAAITKDSLLNEAILDDVQALYRASSIHERTSRGGASGIDKTKIVEYSRLVAGKNIDSRYIDDYLVRSATGAKIEKPRHIFIILGETYAQWPVLDAYSNLDLANGLKALMKEENSAYTKNFLPNGTFTAMAVNALVSGLSDVGLPPNYQQESYQQVYATALAPQLQKLGYQVDFWYGGFPSWERIKDFSLAQGFDHFYSCADFDAAPDNIWGTKDEYIFQALSEKLQEEEPTVHLILTVSNHPPYSLDVVEAGFDANKIIDGLPEDRKSDPEFIKQLGHYWYMDKVISEFVRNTYAAYPDSLFIITGDHADRTNLLETPTPFERYTIPFVLYGQGITKDILPQNIAGGHVNILPTLIELIAPTGFTYYSLADSLTKGSTVGFSSNYWITPNAMGAIDQPGKYSWLPDANGDNLSNEEKMAQEKIAMMRTISWWRITKGNEF